MHRVMPSPGAGCRSEGCPYPVDESSVVVIRLCGGGDGAQLIWA